MEKVIITSTKILFAKWNGTSEEWEEMDITKLDKPISWYMPHVIEVRQGVTIEDVLRVLGKFEDQVDTVYAGYMENCKLRDLLNEIDKEADNDLTDKLECIEFYWNTNLIPLEDDVAEFRLHRFASFRGIIPSGAEEDFEDDEMSLILEEYYEMSIVALRNFKLVPIELNDLVQYIEPEDDTIMLEESILDCSEDWTFHDFVSCLLTELSIYGTPEEKEKLITEMRAEVEEEVFAEKSKVLVLEPIDFFAYLEDE